MIHGLNGAEDIKLVTIKLNVKFSFSQNNDYYAINFEPNDSIYKMKDIISNYCGFCMKDRKLFIGEEELQDEMTLGNYGVSR